MPKAPTIDRPTDLARGPISRGPDRRVVCGGGHQGYGLIRDISVITRGEALGHEAWIDAEMLAQVAAAINAAAIGIKSRFNHPGASGDSFGTMVGRVDRATVSEDRVLGDLHLSEAASKAPDGNMAEYVLAMAEREADAFGTSIAFVRDLDAERTFHEGHGGRYEQDPMGFETLVGFESPDPLNTDNLPHVRLAELRAVDVVDEPAANPAGLFHRGSGDLAARAEAIVGYALGREGLPDDGNFQFGVDPSRVRGFVGRYLNRHNLQITSKESDMPDPHTPPTDPAEKTPPQEAVPDTNPVAEPDAPETQPEPEQPEELSRADQAKPFLNEFGEVQGALYFAAGVELEEARKRELARLRSELSAKDQPSKAAETVPFAADIDKPRKRSAFEFATRRRSA